MFETSFDTEFYTAISGASDEPVTVDIAVDDTVDTSVSDVDMMLLLTESVTTSPTSPTIDIAELFDPQTFSSDLECESEFVDNHTTLTCSEGGVGYGGGGIDNGSGEGGGGGGNPDEGGGSDCPYSICDPTSGGGIPLSPIDQSEVSDLASDIAADILRNELIDPTTGEVIEQSAIIFRDSQGNIRASAIAAGTPNDSTSTFDIPTGAKIIAVVHNHPFLEATVDFDDNTPGIQDFQADRINELSILPSTEDWQELNRLGSLLDDPSLVSTFIIGPDDILRRFTLADESTFNLPNLTSDVTPDGTSLTTGDVPDTTANIVP